MSKSIIPTDKAGVIALLQSFNQKEFNERLELTRKAKIEVINAIATQIANVLGFHVVQKLHDLDEHGNKIADHNGRELSLRMDWSKYRLTIHAIGRYDDKHQYVTPYENGHKIETPSITVAADLLAKVIASEIQRRIFPAYANYLLAVTKYLEAQTKRENAVESHKQEWELILGSKVTRSSHGENLSLHLDKGYGEIQIGEDYVNLKLSSITHEQAIKIAELLADN